VRGGTPILKRVYRIHGWLGLNLGLLTFVVCLSGTIATVSDDLDWLIHRQMRVEPGPGRLSWPEIVDRVRERFPDEPVIGIQAPKGSRFAARVVTALPRTEGLPFSTRLVHVDPRTGQVQGSTSPFLTVQHLFRLFHKQFFIYGTWAPHGTFVVGVFGVTLLFSVLSGFLIYKTWLRHLFTLRRGRSRRFWSDLHRLLGIWTILFTVVISATGAWFLADRVLASAGVADLAGQDILRQPIETSTLGPELGPLDLKAAILAAKEAVPGFELELASLPLVPAQPATLYGRTGPLADSFSTVVVWSPFTSEVLAARSADDLDLGDRINHAMTPLHFGDFGGLASKLPYLVLGLALSFSILAGARIWQVRTKRRVEDRCGRWDTLAALALTAFVLVMAAWHTVRGVRERLPPPDRHVTWEKTAPIGPWTVDLRRGGSVDFGEVSLVLRLVGEGGGFANYREGRVYIGESEGTVLQPYFAGHRVRLPVSEGSVGLELVGPDGESHELEIPESSWRYSGRAGASKGVYEDLQARFPVTLIAAVFVVLVLVVAAWWVRVLGYVGGREPAD